jgi:uncharacterized protein YdeI (YjbR/CyaY-like superfamily)
MEIGKTLYVTRREDWRAWLEQHHATESDIWLVFYRKETGQPSLPYDDAIEEALCFGWIDGIAKKVDAERHTLRFTPRKNTTNWSHPNKKRLHRLLQEGKMTPAGLARVDPAVLKEMENFNPDSEPEEPPLPDGLLEALQTQPPALANFENMAPSYRRQFIGWISQAKREETRQKRIEKSVELLLANKNLTQI